MDDPVAKLGRLYIEARTALLSETSRDYLCQAIETAIRKDEPLHAALGVSRSGRYGNLQARLLREKRDACLVRAFHAIALDKDTSVHAGCKRLARHLCNFIATEWPRERRRLDPDPAWPAWKAAAFRAAQTGLQVDLSANALHLIVQERARFSLNRQWLKVLSDLLV